ncbi:hypothetical protein [Microbacterium testaceum]|uniref:hypothetical protein n=1 Tax=Microbacterium testaceum TaxID=2033 RepID=UPI002AC7E407|nr:hypothetical protein [Microbacterium testaceum]MDZ5145339.1 hypothetical protein [Microbacterium testaceum]
MNWLTRVFFGPGGNLHSSVPASGSDYSAAGTIILPADPWASETSVAALVYSDIFGSTADAVTRETAMSIAPVKRGRAILVGSIADLPLESGSFRSGVWTPAARQGTWFNQSTTAQTAWHRMAHTLDDLIFHGWSLWALNRSEAGTILDAVRVRFDRWSFDDKTPHGIAIDGAPLTDPSAVILFQGPDEGLLANGAELIRGARAMERAWVGRVRNPIPAMVLQETERNGVTPTEAAEYVAAWSKARNSENGAVGFLPSTLNMNVYGDTDADLFTEGRNNTRLDFANLLNLPASLLDGSTATASLTYVTQEGERTALIDYLEYWLAPIEARLSQDDVTPHGQVVRFNRSNLTDVPNDSHGPEVLETGDAVESTPATPEVTA